MGSLRDHDTEDIGIGRAQQVWVANNRVSSMNVEARTYGTNNIEDTQEVFPGRTAEFVAPSGEYWAQVSIKGLGTETQSASGNVTWS